VLGQANVWLQAIAGALRGGNEQPGSVQTASRS
jgi:hypothetical protein